MMDRIDTEFFGHLTHGFLIQVKLDLQSAEKLPDDRIKRDSNLFHHQGT